MSTRLTTHAPQPSREPTVRAWHFALDCAGVPVMRDGQPIVAGAVYEVAPPLRPCLHGLHASELALSALVYAPGLWVSRVELGGEIVRRADRLCATRRRHLWVADARRIIAGWAAWCARCALPLVLEQHRGVAERGIELTERWAGEGDVSAEAL